MSGVFLPFRDETNDTIYTYEGWRHFVSHEPPEKPERLSTVEYQALSPEQKQQLAAGGQVLPGGAAPALKPVDPKKLAAVPVTRSEPASAARSPTPKLRALREAPATQRSAEAASAPAARP